MSDRHWLCRHQLAEHNYAQCEISTATDCIGMHWYYAPDWAVTERQKKVAVMDTGANENTM